MENKFTFEYFHLSSCIRNCRPQNISHLRTHNINGVWKEYHSMGRIFVCNFNCILWICTQNIFSIYWDMCIWLNKNSTRPLCWLFTSEMKPDTDHAYHASHEICKYIPYSSIEKWLCPVFYKINRRPCEIDLDFIPTCLRPIYLL